MMTGDHILAQLVIDRIAAMARKVAPWTGESENELAGAMVFAIQEHPEWMNKKEIS